MDVARETSLETESADQPDEIEEVFRTQYDRIACVIARVIRDPARAEELAVEVFLKWSKQRRSDDDNAKGWLYRTAVRLSLDELRRERRRTRFESMLHIASRVPTPEDVLATTEEAARVRNVLSSIDRRYAELLLLRNEGLSYLEAASVLALNPASVGTLLSRAQDAFRKEYAKRYGRPE